jgi:uncharacterized repeat protein (TIGR03843 family)
VTTEPASVLAESDALELLTRGEMELEGRLVDASNTTLRAEITLDGLTRRCVYKPVRGERPLWDFPDGTLAGREVSAYLVSQATGWNLVPPTILRDGPLGVGACQLWIDEPEDASALIGFVPAYDVPQGWFAVASARDDDGDAYALAHADDPRLARLALLDAVINNADRKGGHVLYAPGGGIYGVDHGVSFHVENKLRTVLWGWTGKPIPAESLETLTARGASDDLRGAARPVAGEAPAPRRAVPPPTAGLAGGSLATRVEACLTSASVLS